MFRVDSVTGSDTATCGSETEPCQTIQQAVNLAVSGDTILVARGTYNSSNVCLTDTAVVCILNKQLTVLGGYAAGNWSIADPSNNVTIIDGQSVRRGVLLQRIGSTAPVASLHMGGFTIRNGLAQGASSGGDAATFAFGGGLLADGSQITLKNMVFENNQAVGGNTNSSYGGAGSGGGLALRAAPAGTLLEHVVFDGNQARGGAGSNRGGFAIGGGLYTLQSVVSGQHITFTNNIATSGSSSGSGVGAGEKADAQGGGVGVQVGSEVTLQYVSARNNQANGGNAGTDAGGAFGGAFFAELATLTLLDADVRQNVALGGNGANGGLGVGGGLQSFDSEVTINRVFMIDNRATGGDGSANRGAAGGGGAYLTRFSGNSIIEITNSIIADNLAEMGTTGNVIGGGGGGLWLQGTQAEIQHTTFARNRLGSAPMQGQAILILNDGAPTPNIANLSYSIIADHTDYAGAAALHVKPGNTANLERTLWAGNGLDTNAGVQSGTINDSNPLTAPSAGFVAPGGPGYDYHLQKSSAARDQAAGSSITIDIDNELRALFGPPDIGADEYAPIVLSVSPVASGTLRLNWKTNTNLVTGLDHYDIVFSAELGSNPPNEGASPIDAGTQTSFTLTGLSNYKQYTLTIEARGSSGALIDVSNSVTTFPTDVVVYLPLALK